jgi:hypothetical protein
VSSVTVLSWGSGTSCLLSLAVRSFVCDVEVRQKRGRWRSGWFLDERVEGETGRDCPSTLTSISRSSSNEAGRALCPEVCRFESGQLCADSDTLLLQLTLDNLVDIPLSRGYTPRSRWPPGPAEPYAHAFHFLDFPCRRTFLFVF